MPRTPEQIWEDAGPADRRLAGVALNPAAPVDVLLRLLAHGAPAVRMVLCRDRALPASVMDAAVAHPDTYTRSFFARNPHVDPEQRARLVDDPEWFVRAHLADPPRSKNPCRPLPDRILVRMISTYGQGELDGTFHLQLSQDLQRAMPTHPEAKLRRWGCGGWSTLTPEVRAALLADPDAEVRDAAARNDTLHTRLNDPAMVEEDLPDHSCHARHGLLLYGALNRAVVAKALAQDDHVLLAANPSCPADVVTLLSQYHDPEVRSRVAGRPDLPAELRRTLAADPDPGVRLSLSLHPALSDEERAAIDYTVTQDGCFGPWPGQHVPRASEEVRRDALSSHPLLRRGAARVPTLPMDLVSRLADDEDLGVRVLLSQNHPDAPGPLLLRSFLEYEGDDRHHLMSRPHFPRDGLARFADADDPSVRLLAPLDQDLSPATADRLTRDPDPLVRAASARHPRLPQDRLAELLDDEDLAHHAAANPALPTSTMYGLLARTGHAA